MAAILCQKRTRQRDGDTLSLPDPRPHPHCRRADILIAAMGAPEFVKEGMVKPGAAVIDVGVNRIPDASAKEGSRLVGDVDFARVQPIAEKYPNPGGVGPMTIAMLMQNTARAAEQSSRRNFVSCATVLTFSPDTMTPTRIFPTSMLPRLRGCPPGVQRQRVPSRHHGHRRVPQVPVTAHKIGVFNRWTAGIGVFTECLGSSRRPDDRAGQERS